jgi:hypothetical protein
LLRYGADVGDEGFWRLIAVLGLSETELPGPTDEEKEALVGPLIDALAALPESEIEDFDDLLAQKLYAIDTETHWKAYGSGSQDGFLYGRCWVVARGRDYYEKVASNPAAMPRFVGEDLEEAMKDESFSLEELRKWPSADLEPLLYAAAYAWEAKTGDEYPGGNRSVSIETGSNRAEHPNRPW